VVVVVVDVDVVVVGPVLVVVVGSGPVVVVVSGTVVVVVDVEVVLDVVVVEELDVVVVGAGVTSNGAVCMAALSLQGRLLSGSVQAVTWCWPRWAPEGTSNVAFNVPLLMAPSPTG
jgi:hypothetical protein